MAKKKMDLDGLEKFNRVSNGSNAILNLIFILISLTCIIPVLLVLAISVSDEDMISEFGYSLIPRAFSPEGFLFLTNQSEMILRAVGISLFVTIVGTVLGVLLTTLMGYTISRPNYKLKGFLTWVVFIPMVFNGGLVSTYFVVGTLLGVLLTTLMGYTISRPNYKLKGFLTWVVFIPMVFNGGLVSTYFVVGTLLGLKNSVWVLILPLAVSSFNVVICKTFFRQTVPDSLIESAKIDGAGQFTIFFRIVLPISLPLLATIGLFLCFSYWNDWYQSMLYIDDTTLKSLQALLNDIMTNITALAANASSMGISAVELAANMPKESARMAIVVIIVLPIACAYPYFQKYFISGLTVGAVKG